MKCPIVADMNGSGKLAVNNMASGLELAKPIAEFGVSEVTHSFAWFNGSSKCIAAGMNMKNIKLIDFRGTFLSNYKGFCENTMFAQILIER